MATKRQTDDQQEQEPQLVILKNEKHDETVPGGRYIVNGRAVNANGEVIPSLRVVNGEIVEV